MNTERFDFKGATGNLLAGLLDLPDGPPHAEPSSRTASPARATRFRRCAYREPSSGGAWPCWRRPGNMRSGLAVATIGAPFEPRPVALLMADGVAELQAQGEARVDIGGRPFKLRRTFLEEHERRDPAGRLRTLGRPLLVLHAAREETVGIVNAQSFSRPRSVPRASSP